MDYLSLSLLCPGTSVAAPQSFSPSIICQLDGMGWCLTLHHEPHSSSYCMSWSLDFIRAAHAYQCSGVTQSYILSQSFPSLFSAFDLSQGTFGLACGFGSSSQGYLRSPQLWHKPQQLLTCLHQNQLQHHMAPHFCKQGGRFSFKTIRFYQLHASCGGVLKPRASLEPIDIDKFALLHTSQVPRFTSFLPHSANYGQDALSQNWLHLRNLAHSSWHLISSTVDLLYFQRPWVIILVPFWSTASWYPHLCRAALDTLLMLKQLNLICWPLGNLGHLLTPGAPSLSWWLPLA